MIRIGSLFSGIGGFELGVERAIPNAKTVWQVEQNTYCQTILKKHWPNAHIYDDVRTVMADKVDSVEILLGGFPCQDLSIAGKQKGVYDGKQSSLWWEMHRIIRTIRPRVVIMENVANIVRVGGTTVVASLTEIGYCTEWTIIKASDFGAPHRRARWFAVAYPEEESNNRRPTTNSNGFRVRTPDQILAGWKTFDVHATEESTNSNSIRCNSRSNIQPEYTNCIYGERDSKKNIKQRSQWESRIGKNSHVRSTTKNFWQRQTPPQPTVCTVDDGISNRLARLTALGNAIVPQCSEWIALQVLNSGLIDDLL